MKLFRFDAEVGRVIEQFDSRGVIMSGVTRFTGKTQVGCMHLAVNSVVGYHPATVPQLFMVVQGSGWVTGADGEGTRERVPIAAGQAAFWEAGEWHESGSEAGMMVIVVESEGLDLDILKLPRET